MASLLKLTRIVQAAAEADGPAAQVKHIVDGIQREMAVDVCSLYLANDEGDMALVASHGLGQAAVGRAIITSGTGLVGFVATTRQPVNVTEPADHPAFHYVSGSLEERFRSFCGVPLVRAGQVVGVLVVQTQESRKLTEDEQAFLVTLSTQLAIIVATWRDWEETDGRAARVYAGIKGAQGVGIGTVLLCDGLELSSVVDAPCVDSEAELSAWRQLIEQVQAEIRAEQAALGDSLSNEVAGIFDAYLMLLADPALSAGVEQGITEGRDLPSALKAVIHHYAELFLAMEDPYLRARHEDIGHLGNRLYSTWRKGHLPAPGEVKGRAIVLVGNQISISDIAGLPREKLVGIACIEGSSLSHTAVLANALGIPAVMGLGEIKGLLNGAPIVVDGNSASVILNPEPAVMAEYRKYASSQRQLHDQLETLRDQPATTTDGQKITLYANSGLIADIAPGLQTGAEGLGLYRTEIPFMISETFPSEDEQYQLYSQVMDAYRGKPVHMRILDVGADKPLPYFPIREENPALGWRGIRFCLDNTALLITQLRAMLRAASATKNLRILLPMVSAAAELVDFHRILDDTVAQLAAEGHDLDRPEVGIMVEVPAAISQLGKWQPYIDFISIGSNDLSQYVIAVDRNNPRVASAYDHLHPSVLHEVGRIVDQARELDLPVSLCGEMASDPGAVVLLLGMGLRTLSMSSAQLPRIKWVIRAVDTEDAERLSQRAAELLNSREIRELVNIYLTGLKLPGLVL